MLTVVNNKLVFSVKFSDNKCVNYTEKDGGGETHITNENRVAGNMYVIIKCLRFTKKRQFKSIYTFINLNVETLTGRVN